MSAEFGGQSVQSAARSLDERRMNGQNPGAARMSSKGPNQRPDEEHDGSLAVEERKKTRRARPYNVVFHNDDYTTMEFVVLVLMKFFHKAETEATQIMLEVHHRGYGVVGVFTRDVAETKADQVMDYAKEHGHPLRVTAEPADDPEEDQ
jgi:ATP-dependent Clp protease adaptor protein ClpS